MTRGSTAHLPIWCKTTSWLCFLRPAFGWPESLSLALSRCGTMITSPCSGYACISFGNKQAFCMRALCNLVIASAAMWPHILPQESCQPLPSPGAIIPRFDACTGHVPVIHKTRWLPLLARRLFMLGELKRKRYTNLRSK